MADPRSGVFVAGSEDGCAGDLRNGAFGVRDQRQVGERWTCYRLLPGNLGL